MRPISQIHSTENRDRIVVGFQHDLANAAGSDLGVPVTTAVEFTDRDLGVGILPAVYAVLVTPSQACMVSVTGKTTSGFSVTLTPDIEVVLAAGTFDVVVLA